jgi:hypothetical protein
LHAGKVVEQDRSDETVKEQMEQRLAELKAEGEAGRETLTELEVDAKNTE